MENKTRADKTSTAHTESVRTLWERAARIWRRAEILLLVVGGVLLIGCAAALLDGYLSSRAALRAFERLDEPPASIATPRPAEKPTAAEPDFSDWDAQRVRAYKAASSAHGSSLGVVEIPKIHLAAPLLEGTDSFTLNHAVGRIAGTARPGEPGKIGIAGHRDSFFRGLKDITPGDTVELRTLSGRDIYTVDRIEIVVPHDVSVLRPEQKPSLTLVTCYPFYFIGSAPKRFVVTAYLTQHLPAGPTTSTPGSPLNPATNQGENQ